MDPLAGSWFVESTTNQMEQLIVEHMAELDERGGIVSAVAEGWAQAEVNRQAYALERRLRDGSFRKVGVNCYQEEEAEEQEVEFHPYRVDQATAQIERLARIRATRDDAAVRRGLGALAAAARAGDNVMPAIIDAVEVYATVGEVCGALKEVYGEYREPVRF